LTRPAWVNEANPARPFLSPNFDRAVYETYDAPEQAVEALRNDEIDLILWPGGSGPAIPSNAEAILSSPSGAAGYLAFNPADPALADPALRQAVACLLEIPQRSLSGTRADFVLPLNSFWHNPEARRACMDLDEDGARQEQAVRILKDAGYSWETGTDGGAPASGLLMPDGNPLPALTLIAAADPAEAPDFLDPQGIARSLQPIGVTLQVETGSPQDLRYRVFSSRAYDLAILDWRLGLYPGYLCGWFGAGGSFDSGSEALHAACAALESEPDLQAARRRVFEIQSLLAEELPFIPLYVEMRTDAIRNIAYPFDSLVGGLGGVYGAPSFAVPAP
jgi:ABC-type transport system substrate-binding protein